jgi:hypothetical protein
MVTTSYSINSYDKKWAHSLEEIIKKIEFQYRTLSGVIPYTMFQATMANKNEYKVIIFK